MNLLYKLLKQDKNKREGVVTVTSALGIILNLLIASVKVVIGIAASSIAIISEGVNNATDAATSVLAIVGTKLSAKRPDKNHPFGYGRIEYLTSLVISGLIIFTGVEMIINSVEMIFNPTVLDISYLTLAIVAISAVIKFFLGIYTIKTGKRIDSTSLVALGTECRNDSFVSLVTIISAVVFLIFDFSIDAYAGIITSLFILKAGIEVLRETISELLGRPGKTELALKLYKEIRSTEGIINAVDMMLHNYGPDSYSGSVNIELDHEEAVGDVYKRIHELQLRIMHEYNVTMVFGIYAVDNDHAEVKEIRKEIASYVRSHEHLISYHALYMEPGTNDLYLDFIVDYDLKNWDELRDDFRQYMKKLLPEKNIILTIETDFV